MFAAKLPAIVIFSRKQKEELFFHYSSLFFSVARPPLMRVSLEAGGGILTLNPRHALPCATFSHSPVRTPTPTSTGIVALVSLPPRAPGGSAVLIAHL